MNVLVELISTADGKTYKEKVSVFFVSEKQKQFKLNKLLRYRYPAGFTIEKTTDDEEQEFPKIQLKG